VKIMRSVFSTALKVFALTAMLATTVANAQTPEEWRKRREQQQGGTRPAPQPTPPVARPAPQPQPQVQQPQVQQPQYRQPGPPVMREERRHHVERPHVQQPMFPFPVIIPQTRYIDRPVYVDEQPRYYAPAPRYYDEQPVYYAPRARRQVCRTIVARDKWGGRHYVKKCRPARRR
jgi:hypothetical protein